MFFCNVGLDKVMKFFEKEMAYFSGKIRIKKQTNQESTEKKIAVLNMFFLPSHKFFFLSYSILYNYKKIVNYGNQAMMSFSDIQWLLGQPVVAVLATLYMTQRKHIYVFL